MPVYRGPGGAGDATNDATVTAVQSAATSAATSATAAANSATAAANSATGAATSATNAANSATTAAGQATTAAGHATNASTFATNSSLSATDSADSATEAEGYASEAFDYKVAAASSASSASTSATNSAASSATATTAVNNALSLYGDAAALDAAVTAAQLAETNAETAETNAETAATTATNAASTATTQATNAAASALAADADATSASIDANEAQAAATAAQAAVSSATAIYGSIEDIQQAEANSEANRDAAAASATSASNSASTATTQAGIATTQATNAATSAAQASAVALGNEPVRHSVRPSLLLDFANTKTLDPRITFTRASTGTFYDGKTVALAEQNLFERSQEFDNAYWTKQNSTVTANSTAAPDGTTTADSLVEDAFTAVHRVGRSSVASGVTGAFTFSFFAKANTRSRVVIALSDSVGSGNVNYACFNLSTGVFDAGATTAGSGWSSASVTSTALANSWYRVSITATRTTSGNVAGEIQLDAGTSGTFNNSYAGNGTSGIFIWGAQLEQRSTVTAYTATTTAAITNYIPVLQTAAAGVARFEHNPVTGESLGLEIEEQRTNLLLYSEQFDNAAWNKTSFPVTATANQLVAPDGTISAELLSNATNNTRHYIFQSFASGVAATAYTASIYVKKGTQRYIVIGDAGDSVWHVVTFDFDTATITSQINATGAVTVVGNGWYRVSITFTRTNAGSVTILAAFSSASSNASPPTYVGAETDNFYIWGAQLEAGAFATSYIPTVASQVTRVADSASMTGTNFSSWYRADEGTIYAEANPFESTFGTRYFYGLNDGSGSNVFGWFKSASAYGSVILTNGVSQGSLFVGTATANVSAKATLSYKFNDVAFTANGGTVSPDSSVIVPVVNQLTIGAFLGTTSQVNCNIKKLAYYPKRLQNSELVALTTI